MTFLSSFLDDGQHADHIEVGWVRRGSPGHGDTRRTKNKPSRPENLRPQEDLTQDLSAAGRSYSGSVGRRKILLRICRPQEDLTSARKLIILELLAELKKPKRNTIAKTQKEYPIMCYTVKKRREVY